MRSILAEFQILRMAVSIFVYGYNVLFIWRLWPAPSPPMNTRELELTTVHRTIVETTTTVSVSETLQVPHVISDAQTQTSLIWNEKKDEAEEYISEAPEVTHLEVPLSRFEEVLLPNPWEFPILDSAAQTLLRDEEFQRTIRYYRETVKEEEEDPDAIHPPGQDIEDYLTKILNMISSRCPTTGGARPFDIGFVDNRRFEETPEPHEPPGIAGAFVADDISYFYQWKDVAVLIGDGLDFEAEAGALDTQSNPTRSPNSSRHPTPSRKSATPEPSSASKRGFTTTRGSRFSKSRSPRPFQKQRSDSPRSPKDSRLESSNQPSSSKQRAPEPPEDLSRMAQETLSASGNRRHVIAITITDIVVRLWYFDRAGTIRTAPTKLNDASFARAFMRLVYADASHIGFEDAFEPSIHPDEKSPSPTDVVGSRVLVQGSYFTISEKLHSAMELHGRGTAVYAAQNLEMVQSKDDGASALQTMPKQVVVKFSWQLTDWHSEDALYLLAERYGVRGISRLYRSASIARLSQGLRGRLLKSSQYRDRELRAQVMGPIAIPLLRVKDLDTFKAAFKSLVEGDLQHIFL